MYRCHFQVCFGFSWKLINKIPLFAGQCIVENNKKIISLKRELRVTFVVKTLQFMYSCKQISHHEAFK